MCSYTVYPSTASTQWKEREKRANQSWSMPYLKTNGWMFLLGYLPYLAPLRGKEELGMKTDRKSVV